MTTATGFPPQSRLRSAADFAGMRSVPGRVDTRHFLIRYGSGATAVTRLGLAVSKRVSKSAVQRNRIKRLARESFRSTRQQLPLLDVLVVARAHAAGVASKALREDLDRAWPRLKSLKPGPVPGTIAD